MTKEQFTGWLEEIGYTKNIIDTLWADRPPNSESMPDDECERRTKDAGRFAAILWGITLK